MNRRPANADTRPRKKPKVFVDTERTFIQKSLGFPVVHHAAAAAAAAAVAVPPQVSVVQFRQMTIREAFTTTPAAVQPYQPAPQEFPRSPDRANASASSSPLPENHDDLLPLCEHPKWTDKSARKILNKITARHKENDPNIYGETVDWNLKKYSTYFEAYGVNLEYRQVFHFNHYVVVHDGKTQFLIIDVLLPDDRKQIGSLIFEEDNEMGSIEVAVPGRGFGTILVLAAALIKDGKFIVPLLGVKEINSEHMTPDGQGLINRCIEFGIICRKCQVECYENTAVSPPHL